MVVKNGAIITYAGQWPNPNTVVGQLFHPLALVVSEISAGLGGDGLSVLRADYDSGIISASFPITLKMLNSRGDFGSEQDVVSLVRHEVYKVTGAFPLSDSIPSIQNPQSAPVNTGQPSIPVSSSGSVGDFLSGAAGGLTTATASFTDVLSELANNTKLVVVGLALGLITAVLLIARRP